MSNLSSIMKKANFMTCSNFQRSSPWIFVLCAIRGTEYMTMVVITSDNSTLESIEALTGSWGYVHNSLVGKLLTQCRFFLGLTVVNAIVREYFGEVIAEPEPGIPFPKSQLIMH